MTITITEKLGKFFSSSQDNHFRRAIEQAIELSRTLEDEKEEDEKDEQHGHSHDRPTPLSSPDRKEGGTRKKFFSSFLLDDSAPTPSSLSSLIPSSLAASLAQLSPSKKSKYRPSPFSFPSSTGEEEQQYQERVEEEENSRNAQSIAKDKSLFPPSLAASLAQLSPSKKSKYRPSPFSFPSSTGEEEQQYQERVEDEENSRNPQSMVKHNNNAEQKLEATLSVPTTIRKRKFKKKIKRKDSHKSKSNQIEEDPSKKPARRYENMHQTILQVKENARQILSQQRKLQQQAELDRLDEKRRIEEQLKNIQSIRQAQFITRNHSSIKVSKKYQPLAPSKIVGISSSSSIMDPPKLEKEEERDTSCTWSSPFLQRLAQQQLDQRVFIKARHECRRRTSWHWLKARAKRELESQLRHKEEAEAQTKMHQCEEKERQIVQWTVKQRLLQTQLETLEREQREILRRRYDESKSRKISREKKSRKTQRQWMRQREVLLIEWERDEEARSKEHVLARIQAQRRTSSTASVSSPTCPAPASALAPAPASAPTSQYHSSSSALTASTQSPAPAPASPSGVTNHSFTNDESMQSTVRSVISSSVNEKIATKDTTVSSIQETIQNMPDAVLFCYSSDSDCAEEEREQEDDIYVFD